MSNSFDDMPFFDEEPGDAPRKPQQPAAPARAPAAGGGIAARAMAARDGGRPDYLTGLNPEQREAVETLEGPVLVLAGAGTGKTRVLTTRIAHILQTGRAFPSQILAVTFTNKAAREMKERIALLVGGAVEGMPWLGTFHSIGVKLLRRHAELVGLRSDFTILDTDDVIRLIKQIIQAEGLDDKRWPAKQFAGMIDTWKNKGLGPADIPEGDARAFANGRGRDLYFAYQNRLSTLNACDFGDLLMHPIAIFRKQPDLLKEYHQKFRFILVDEYQDTNRLQSSILLALKPTGQGLTVVGDDAQSIYSFRAATVRNILDFPASFSPAANIVTLDRNYRSTQPILAAANAVIDLASERFTKNLWTERESPERPRLVTVRDENDQARYVADKVLDNREEGVKLKSQAVLFRASHHSGPLEVELTRRNIPFVKFGGLKFLDSAHVKDMLAALRFAQNPRDRVAGFRLMQILPGVGPSTAQKVLDQMADDASPIAALAVMPAPPRSGEEWTSFVSTMQELKTGKAGWPAEIELVRRWYEPHLERLHEDASARLADLVQLEQIAGGYASRERFLTELTLDPPDATSDQAGVPLLDEDYLILSTIHSAKGQEWTKVFMLNVIDGCIPSDLAVGTTAEIEEERRLLYVAMTRAKDSLDLVVPQRFFTYGQNSQGDRHVYASRSRFIPATLLQFFEVCGWPQVKTDTAAAQQARQVRIDVGARMRGMWR